MMAISRSTQFDGSCNGIHFCFIQFLYLYVYIPMLFCYKVGFSQYHMVLIDLDVNETFFITNTLPRNNGMLDFFFTATIHSYKLSNFYIL